MSKQSKALETKASEVAADHSCIAIKSTKRLPVDGGAGFQVVDSKTRLVRAGKDFDLSAKQVIQLFEESAA